MEGAPVRDASPDLPLLLARVALQDQIAFEQLYRATAPHLLGLAHGVLHSRERAEEVLQEAFMNVWYGAATYNPALASPMTWLINIVRNKAIDRHRTGQAERTSTGAYDAEAFALAADPAAQPEQLFEASLSRVHIDQCMATLTAPQRQAVALAYYSGQVHADIAVTLGAPLGTVKAWVRRGVDRLKGCLEAAGVGAA